MSSDDLTLDLLLAEVAKEGNALSTYLNDQSYYQPGFRSGLAQYPPDLPEYIQASRLKLQNAAKALYQLASGPAEHITNLASSVRTSQAFTPTKQNKTRSDETLTQPSSTNKARPSTGSSTSASHKPSPSWAPRPTPN